MTADVAKKQRLGESSHSFTYPPTKRKRLVNRDVLHKVFGLFYEKAWYRRLAKGDDVLAQLFVLNPLGHRYVIRLLQSVESVTVEDNCGTPVCRLVGYKVGAGG
ncbi:hypothetical protein AAVH_14933 [Aphelenchoides avenae]|nr:hypothetical protein AAVH_14933 [Aphelenchus avenae]